MALTALFVARAAAGRASPGRHYDGNGLVMQVKETGAASWLFRYDRNRRRHEVGLGAVKSVGLKEAREKAVDYRRTLASGSDPLRAKRLNGHRTSGPTFLDVAEEYMAAHGKGWRNAKHRRQWKDTLALAYPTIGHLAPADITAADVIAILKPLWERTPATASRLRGRLQKVRQRRRRKGCASGTVTLRHGPGISTRCSRVLACCTQPNIILRCPWPTCRGRGQVETGGGR